MPTEYEKAHATYRELVKKAASGDAVAKSEKAKVMNDIRAIERDAARAGTVLSASYQGDQIKTQSQTVRSKRSMQEEYVHKFDGEAVVNVGGKEQTLREYHSKRLLGK